MTTSSKICSPWCNDRGGKLTHDGEAGVFSSLHFLIGALKVPSQFADNKMAGTGALIYKSWRTHCAHANRTGRNTHGAVRSALSW